MKFDYDVIVMAAAMQAAKRQQPLPTWERKPALSPWT